MKHQGDGANQNHPRVRDRVGLGHHPGSLPLVWTWEPFSVWRGNVPAGENKSAYVTS